MRTLLVIFLLLGLAAVTARKNGKQAKANHAPKPKLDSVQEEVPGEMIIINYEDMDDETKLDSVEEEDSGEINEDATERKVGEPELESVEEEASGDLNEDANEDKVEEPKVESVEEVASGDPINEIVSEDEDVDGEPKLDSDDEEASGDPINEIVSEDEDVVGEPKLDSDDNDASHNIGEMTGAAVESFENVKADKRSGSGETVADQLYYQQNNYQQWNGQNQYKVKPTEGPTTGPTGGPTTGPTTGPGGTNPGPTPSEGPTKDGMPVPFRGCWLQMKSDMSWRWNNGVYGMGICGGYIRNKKCQWFWTATPEKYPFISCSTLWLEDDPNDKVKPTEPTSKPTQPTVSKPTDTATERPVTDKATVKPTDPPVTESSCKCEAWLYPLKCVNGKIFRWRSCTPKYCAAEDEHVSCDLAGN